MSTDNPVTANNSSILSLGSEAVVEAESVQIEGKGGASVGGSPLGWGVSRFRQVLASSPLSVKEGGGRTPRRDTLATPPRRDTIATPPRDTLAPGGPYT
jgi:hypothetical protein